MSFKKTVAEIVKNVLSALKEAGYSEYTLKGFRQKYDSLLKYCAENNIEYYTEEVGALYLEHIANTRTFNTKSASMAFSREIARLDYALKGLPWKHVKRELLPYEESIFNDIVSRYEQYLKEKKTSLFRFSTSIVARFLKQVELSGCIDLNTLDAKTIYDIFIRETINTEYYRRHIKPFCKYAHVYGLTKANLALVVPVKKRRNNVPSVYTPEEVERVLASVDFTTTNGNRDYAIILIAARLGLRAGDIAKLKIGNINFSDSTIRIVQSKTRKPLKLPMSDEIKITLQRYISTLKSKEPDEFLFRRQFSVEGLTGSGVSFIVHSAFLRADVDRTNKKSSAHALRASLATALLNEGNDYGVIRDVLGHSDIQTSKAYVKTEIEKLRSNAIPVPPASGSFAMLLNKTEASI